MEQLVKELVEKANLTEEQATKATEVMLAFVKSKVPPMFQDKVDDMIAGKFDMSSIASMLGGSPLDMLKGMFGKK